MDREELKELSEFNNRYLELKEENKRLKESLRKILMEAGGTSPYAGLYDIFQLAKGALTPKQ